MYEENESEDVHYEYHTCKEKCKGFWDCCYFFCCYCCILIRQKHNEEYKER